MESSFAIIAEPNRRTILSLLASSERSVGEIEHRLREDRRTALADLRAKIRSIIPRGAVMG
jgi:DNA-binding transcriptional ArsR family regulator